MKINKKALFKALGMTAGLVAVATLLGLALSCSRWLGWVALAGLFAAIVYTFYEMMRED